MYLDHFGLNQPPFKITPNTEFFYTGGNRGAILDALLYAIIHGEGIVKVTGEIGSGKTMLCRMLESILPENVEAIYLANPSLNRDEVFHAIAGELNLATEGRRAGEILRQLQDCLIEKHAATRQVVLLVEEAQAMPLDTLEEIRLLSNLETAHHKLLQIVLFGQPELDEHLALPQMRQLKERITHSFKVPPLDQKDIPEYLMFRMRAAGYRGPDIFSAGAIKRIAAASQGITRRINVLADKSLLAAFAENTHTIMPRHARTAISDSDFFVPTSSLPLKKIGSAIAILGLGIALGAGWQNFTILPSPLATLIPGEPSAEGMPRPPVAAVASPAAQPPVQGAPATAPATSADDPEAAAPQSAQEKPSPSPAAAAPPAPEEKPSLAEPVPTLMPGLLLQRLEATRTWLTKENDAHFSIQLMVTDADAETLSRLERFFRNAPLEPQQLYLYPSALTGKKGFGVLFGSFPTRAEAQTSLANLPKSIKANRPILRTIKGIKAEIMEQQTTSNNS